MWDHYVTWPPGQGSAPGERAVAPDRAAEDHEVCAAPFEQRRENAQRARVRFLGLDPTDHPHHQRIAGNGPARPPVTSAPRAGSPACPAGI